MAKISTEVKNLNGSTATPSAEAAATTPNVSWIEGEVTYVHMYVGE